MYGWKRPPPGVGEKLDASKWHDEAGTGRDMYYTPPEGLTPGPLTNKWDLWSFGLTIFEMVANNLLWRLCPGLSGLVLRTAAIQSPHRSTSC